jgi:hypothetical protein
LELNQFGNTKFNKINTRFALRMLFRISRISSSA